MRGENMMAQTTNLETEMTVKWIVDGQILFIDVKVTATNKMPDYDQMIVDYLDATSNIVDLIIRLPQPKQAPPSLKRLTSYKYQQHPRLGYVVMIGLTVSPVIRFFITSAAKIRGLKMLAFPTLEDAERYLRSVRQL
jgi:hypothetical protein